MSLQRLQSFSFLKSSRFLFQFLKLPGKSILSNDDVSYFYSEITGGIQDNSVANRLDTDLMRDLSFVCESIEFPGQTLTTAESRIPGSLKIKTPVLRDYNEITASFLYPAEVPVYEMFSNWVINASIKNTRTQYYNDIVGEARIVQFLEGGSVIDATEQTGVASRKIEGQAPHNSIKLYNIYPISFAPIQSNWGDDGFQRLSVTFYFEGIDIKPYGRYADGRESAAVNARASRNRNTISRGFVGPRD